MICPYVLGILWAIGRYDAENEIFILRHQNSYFLEVLKNYFGSDAKVFFLKRFYVLKLAKYCFAIETLIQLGWSARNSHDRVYPSINSHRDFIRGYFEIHGRISKVNLRHKSGRVQTQKRMRIFGNETFIQSLNEIISFELGISERKLEHTQVEHSKTLAYYKLEDIKAVFDWLYAGTGLKNEELEKEFRSMLEG